MSRVHNHNPDEGLGLRCPETRFSDGTLLGLCMDPAPSVATRPHINLVDLIHINPTDNPMLSLTDNVAVVWHYSDGVVVILNRYTTGKIILKENATCGGIIDHTNEPFLISLALETLAAARRQDIPIYRGIGRHDDPTDIDNTSIDDLISKILDN